MPLDSINRLNSIDIFSPAASLTSVNETFSVGPIEIPSQITSSTSMSGKIIYTLISVISLGLVPLAKHQLSKILTRNVLPAMSANPARKMADHRMKKAYINHRQEKVQEFDLKQDDGAIVNGMAIFKNNAEKTDFAGKNAASQKWIINFNGNNQFYEEGLQRFEEIGKNFDANVLVFNYRGVGDSRGEAATPADWVADGEACIRYLLSKGVPEENILIPGLSLGGAVGTIAASLHEKISLMNERSFGLLSEEAVALTGISFLGKLFRALNCELDVVAAYNKITARKMIVLHKQDLVMPYHATMYKMMKEFIKKNNPDAVEIRMHKGRLKSRLKPEFKPNRIKLQKNFGRVTSDAHNYNIQNDAAYPQISAFIKSCLRK